MSLKLDFPIFENNPGLVYLDNAATTLKPQLVIDGISDYLANDYANIHRGSYSLSQKSEEMYFYSKRVVANVLGGKEHEIVYTYNSTYAFNILATTLVKSGYLKKGDKVLLSIAEHHANIVPWILISQEYGIVIDYIDITPNYEIDLNSLKDKYDDSVKLISLTHVSNVTGSVTDLKAVKSILRDDTLFCVDGSQAVPNFKVDVNEIGCHFYIFTGHKVMASTGIGVLWIKREILKTLKSSIGGGGSILEVTKNDFTYAKGYESLEPGTTNLVGAVSLIKAFEYIEKIGGFEKVEQIEKKLTAYTLEKFHAIKDKVVLLGNYSSDRIGVFSFSLLNGTEMRLFGEELANENICVRCGGHCAHPLHTQAGLKGTCRMSLYIYNDEKDIDKFFEQLILLAN
ncbi:MAG: cysteine desulfurase [Candidatus Absconditabacteria bacterium]